MELFKLLGRIAVDNSEANRAIDDTVSHVQNTESRLGSTLKKIGGAVAAAFAVDKIKDFGQACVDVTAAVSAEQSAFEQIMGGYSDTAKEKMGEVADATGMVDSRLTTYMTSMTAKFKGLGYDVSDSTDLAQRGLTLAADSAAFWDKSLDESMSHLNSFINGSYEGGEAIGLFANDTQMAAYAVEKGLVAYDGNRNVLTSLTSGPFPTFKTGENVITFELIRETWEFGGLPYISHDMSLGYFGYRKNERWY